MNIEKELFPEAWELIIDEDGIGSALIVDEELDTFNVSFVGDGTVEINMQESNYIILDRRALKKIIALINKHEKLTETI